MGKVALDSCVHGLSDLNPRLALYSKLIPRVHDITCIVRHQSRPVFGRHPLFGLRLVKHLPLGKAVRQLNSKAMWRCVPLRQ